MDRIFHGKQYRKEDDERLKQSNSIWKDVSVVVKK